MLKKLKLILPLALVISVLISTAVSAGFAGVVDGDVVNVRTAPAVDGEVAARLGYGTPVNIIGYVSDGWYKISIGELVGWMHEDYIIVKPAKYESLPDTLSEGEKIARFAMGYLGFPYVYGGASPETGFDCSGFVKYVMNSCGYEVNRVACDQALNGVEVSFYELQPGDILLFGSPEYIDHSGLYIGNGKFIHASTEETGVIISDLSSEYNTVHYVTARRIAE